MRLKQYDRLSQQQLSFLLLLLLYTVSQKTHQLCNGIRNWFWWHLAEIFKIL